MVAEVSPKAVEVLDRLARQQSARTLFRRTPRIDLPTAGELVHSMAARAVGLERPDDDTSGSNDAHATSTESERGSEVRRELRGGSRRGVPQGARGMLIALVVVLLVGAVVLQRRPPPIEQRLPMASAVQDVDAVPAEAGLGRAQDGPGPSSADPASGGTDEQDLGPVFVHVAGAVDSPGVVELGPDSRVVDAVRAAGGLRADADPDRVNLAAPISDGQRVVVPVVGQPPPEEVPLTAAPSGATEAESATPTIDVNSASSSELEQLPGIGPATATAIIAHRESKGPFASVDSLLDVRGIGEAKLEAIRDLVVVSGAR